MQFAGGADAFLTVYGSATVQTGGAIVSPTGDAIVDVGFPGSITVLSTGNAISPGWEFNLADSTGGSVLTVIGSLNINGGTVRHEHDNSLRVYGTVTILGAGNLTSTKSGAGDTAFVNGGGTIDIQGTGTWSVAGNPSSEVVVATAGRLSVGPSALVNGVGDFVLQAGASIEIGSTTGISTSPTITGNVVNTGGTRTFDPAANYMYDGTAAQITGTGLVTAANLTINNAANVTQTNPTVTVNGVLYLQTGDLRRAPVQTSW